MTSVEILKTIIKDGNCNQIHCFGDNIFTNFGTLCPLFADCNKTKTDQVEKAIERLDSFLELKNEKN